VKTAIALSVERWSAWAPGLDTAQQWQDWLRAPQPLRGDEPAAPPLAEVPAMARRRIEPLGRAALQVAYRAQDDLDAEAVAAMPLVFASRWGELARSVAMLQELAQGEPLSPTAFSHSVHNAVGAQYSIQRGVRANVSAVAGGVCSAEAGWMEALGLIADGAPAVLLTVFDATLPAAYASTALDAPLSRLHAYALRLRPAAQGGVLLQAQSGAAPQRDQILPPSLRLLRFLLGSEPELRQGEGGAHWLWGRGHA
jgi:Beta-ketoacyl synthase, N-terminal domain